MSSQQAAIHVEQITKLYGDFRAVDDLSFDVHAGEIFAMLGPNGAGKSTTIRMILDIMKPDSGRISVLGGPINDRIKDRIGYLPEERGLYRNVKVIDVMIFLSGLKGVSRHDARRRGMALLEKLELAEHADKKVSELSKGMQQKVQVAVTVLHQPDLIIVDELFSGLDPVNTLVIKGLINEMKANGTAIVMSTHQMHQVEEMADRLLMINKGHQALYGPVDAVRNDFALHAVVLEGEGDWVQLNSVTHTEPGRRPGQTLLYLRDDATPNDLLGEIARLDAMRLDRFELAVPSLNDIFIRVAGQSVEEIEREAAAAAKEPVA